MSSWLKFTLITALLPSSLMAQSVASIPRGGTGNTSFTASRCVQVNSTGTKLEAAAAACGSGGGGGGTVTSVGLLGTANQITITGASPITTSGSWTISLPTSLILPNGTTATTQTLGDNTTKVATDAFVIANAVERQSNEVLWIGIHHQWGPERGCNNIGDIGGDGGQG